jgi:D-alanyl-lipoteichoic acid acyltransferase DltB (MBOAT superfamily)
MRNFAYPYFSRSIAEFWRRWHISLSSWFRDYIYIPLGGGRGKLTMRIRNIFIVFMLSGLWHGANWTFVVWGLLHALYFIPLPFSTEAKFADAEDQGAPALTTVDITKILVTFTLTSFAWIFFRSSSIDNALDYVGKIFSTSMFESPGIVPYMSLLLVAFLIVMEWAGRKEEYAIATVGLKWKRPFRLAFYYALLLIIFAFAGTPQEFIYFQF